MPVAKKTLRVAPDRVIYVPKAAAERLRHATRMSTAELLAEIRRHAVLMDGLDQDGSLSAANKALLEDGVSAQQLDCMTIADVCREVDRRGLELHFPNYTLEFYALWSRLDEADFIVVLRRGANGIAALHDLAPRIKPQGSPWDWHGVMPPNQAFRQSRHLSGGPALEEDDFDDSIEPFPRTRAEPQWTHRYMAMWKEPRGKLQLQDLLKVEAGTDPLSLVSDAAELARGDAPTLGCLLLLKNRVGEIERFWEIEPWIESGYVSEVRSIAIA